jgi:hypothetical protein
MFLFISAPIRETLTEHEFISVVNQIEAAVNSMALVFALEIAEHGTWRCQQNRRERLTHFN